MPFITITFNGYFSSKMQSNKHYMHLLDKYLRDLEIKSKNVTFPNWKAGFMAQSAEFKKQFPNYDGIWLLTYLIKTANDIFKKPMQIFQ